MKINATKYEANEINNIEHNRNRIYLNDFLDICEKFKITITLEKK